MHGCVNTNIYKKCLGNIFKLFFKKQSFKRRGRGREWVRWTLTFIFSEVGRGRTKPNRWVERSPKMRNLHRCHCQQKFSKYEKTTKTYRLGFTGSPISSQRVIKPIVANHAFFNLIILLGSILSLIPILL